MPPRPIRKRPNRRLSVGNLQRIVVLGIIFGVVTFGILFAKLWQLQVVEHDTLTERAVKQQPRGTVMIAVLVTFPYSSAAAGVMIARLLFREAALGEAFNINSAESRTWGEIADYYTDICGLQAVWVDKEDYLNILNPDPYNLGVRWQLEYARLFDRVVDNSKALAVTGMRQSDMMPLYDGLKMEIDRTPMDYPWPNNDRMDAYLAGKLKK